MMALMSIVAVIVMVMVMMVVVMAMIMVIVIVMLMMIVTVSAMMSIRTEVVVSTHAPRRSAHQYAVLVVVAVFRARSAGILCIEMWPFNLYRGVVDSKLSMQ